MQPIRKYSLVALLLGLTYANAQTFLIGVVKDRYTLDQLPYTSITLGNKALCVTDEKGCFKIKLSEKSDSLGFTFVGYKRIGLSSVELSTQDTNIILLEPNENNFNDVEVSAESGFKKTVKAGSKKKKHYGQFYTNVNIQQALFFSNEKHRKGIITKVGYFITDEGNPHTNFRVRIHKANKNLEPDGEILLSNIVASDSLNGNNWVDIDLEKYRIKIPEYGFFVAMEWLPESGNFVYELEIGSQAISFKGQVLGGTSEFNKDLYWSINPDGRGFLHKKREDMINYLSPMIRAELKIK